jgi:hypothetical protein
VVRGVASVMPPDMGERWPVATHTQRSAGPAKYLPARDVAYLILLRLVDEKEGQLRLTALGRERYHGLPNDAAMSDAKDEAAAVLRRHLLHERDR